MRLRPLTEAECYARCYGGRQEEFASLVWLVHPAEQGPTEAALEVNRSPMPEAGDSREAA